MGLCSKMKVHTGAGQRPVKTSGRRISSKVLHPAVSTLDDKEVLFLFSLLNVIKLRGWGPVTPSVLPFQNILLLQLMTRL